MLSFDVLIGLHKVPEFFLALFSQELTERGLSGCNVKFEQLVSLTGNFQVHTDQATAVTYLASSSRGVFAHFVVRVVVMALESALADSAESNSDSTKQRSLILKVKPEKGAHKTWSK